MTEAKTKKYVAGTTIKHNGEYYQKGQTIELTARQADLIQSSLSGEQKKAPKGEDAKGEEPKGKEPKGK